MANSAFLDHLLVLVVAGSPATLRNQNLQMTFSLAKKLATLASSIPLSLMILLYAVSSEILVSTSRLLKL
jgi:hypothetical protein